MKNENNVDRVVRVILAVALGAASWFALGVGEGSVLGIVAAGAALILAGTAAVGFCPAYRLLGISTCKLQSKPSSE